MGQLKERLARKATSKLIESVVNEVIACPETFSELYQLTLETDEKLAWNALWACEKVGDQRPEWLASRYDEWVERLLHCCHEGSKRILLAILYNMQVQTPISVPLLNFCFSHGFSPQESVGVQALSIRMAHKLCMAEPALLPELKVLLETADESIFSKGVQATIRGVRKKL